jgi:hypothetical protein
MFRQCSWDSLETCDAGDDEKGAQRPAGKVIAKGVVNTRHKTEGLQTSDDSGGSIDFVFVYWHLILVTPDGPRFRSTFLPRLPLAMVVLF